MRPSTLVVFDGQSLNNIPSGGDMPAAVMNGRGVAWANVSISGQAWSTLAGSASKRCHPLATSHGTSVLILNGGQSDILNTGDDDTAATALADMESYADNARTAGFDTIIACTLPPSTSFDADDETQRLALNAAIRTSDSWDEVVDLAANEDLDDASDLTYYSDGLHWTAVAAAAAASSVGAVLDTVL